MSPVPDFYSINEVLKPQQNRVYHNNGSRCCRPASRWRATQLGDDLARPVVIFRQMSAEPAPTATGCVKTATA